MDVTSCDHDLQKEDDEETSSPVESSNTNVGTLQYMIEDCLLEIFSKYLDIIDLCSIAETCKRFRSIIPRVCGKSFSFDANKKSYRFDSVNIRHHTRKRSEVGKIFRYFGSRLSEVRVSGAEECFVLHLANKYCDTSLKVLDLSHLNISAILAEQLKPVFRQLQTLELRDVTFEWNEFMFKELDSLAELQVRSIENCSIILDNVFPKLSQFVYENNSVIPDSEDLYNKSFESLSAFIARHSALKSLTIHLTNCDHIRWTLILQTIGINCIELKKLTIGRGYMPDYLCASLKPMHTLKSLRYLFLWGMTFKNFEDFVPLAELYKLKLANCYLPQDIDQFACLAQLHNLSLMCCRSIGAFDVIDIIGQLINLEKFKMMDAIFDGREFMLDEATTLKIDDAVKRRSKALSMKCVRDYTGRMWFTHIIFQPNTRYN